ncbi:MAG: ABC transporter ATP-binding protein [Trichloromonadaceae bacterium]
MSAAPLIRLEGLVKSFQQGDLEIPVLKGLDLEITAGEFIALQGTSGSGKSTLLHILGLLDRPSGGRYLLQGEDVAGHSDQRLSQLRNAVMGFLFQSFYLVPYISALENVVLPGLYSQTPGRALRQRAQELLAEVGLADRMSFRPGQLSGGQQQRVALARALVNGPQLLLADEPTGQLDSATSVEIMQLLSRVHASGRTVIVVTHDPATAAYAKRTISLQDGHVLAG